MILAVGIDVSKSKLDIFCNGRLTTIDNNRNAILEYFSKITEECRIVVEATSKYHRLVHATLSQLGFKVMVINPYQSRHFARALNVICKTDKVDAKVLSLFAEKMEFKASSCPSEDEERLQDLSRHLDDLKKTKKDLASRQRDADEFIHGSLENILEKIEKEIKETEKALGDITRQVESLKNKVDLLTTIPGIGLTTAIALLSYMREIGCLSKREAAALAGLAPMNNDSGTFKGRRSIRRGRHDIRSHLYMPILGAATKYNKPLKEFYDRLVNAGKPKKVALTACMRKMVIWANAMLTNNQVWKEQNA